MVAGLLYFLILYRKSRNGYCLGTDNTKKDIGIEYIAIKEARRF
jgi:hypothetical protein